MTLSLYSLFTSMQRQWVKAYSRPSCHSFWLIQFFCNPHVCVQGCFVLQWSGGGSFAWRRVCQSVAHCSSGCFPAQAGSFSELKPAGGSWPGCHRGARMYCRAPASILRTGATSWRVGPLPSATHFYSHNYHLNLYSFDYNFDQGFQKVCTQTKCHEVTSWHWMRIPGGNISCCHRPWEIHYQNCASHA